MDHLKKKENENKEKNLQEETICCMKCLWSKEWAGVIVIYKKYECEVESIHMWIGYALLGYFINHRMELIPLCTLALSLLKRFFVNKRNRTQLWMENI